MSLCVTVELTIDLTKYLQSCAAKLFSKSKSVSELLLLLKPANEDSATATTDDQGTMESMDNDDNGRKPSVSGSPGGEVSDVARWTYCTRLTDWLYHVS